MSGEKELEDQIAEYLHGRLSQDEADRFETRMLGDQELFRHVQAEALLTEGLVRAKPQPAATATQIPPLGFRGWSGYLLAGGLAVAVLGLGLRVHELSRQLEQPGLPVSDVQVITLFDERSLQPQSIGRADLAASEKARLIEIDVSAHEADGPFELFIETEQGSVRWADRRADERGYLTVYLPPGEVLIRLVVRDASDRLVRVHPQVE
jgi:hypothetical protein